jgi:ribonuclease Z
LVLRDSRFDIEAYALDHAVDCYGYRIKEPDSISMRSDVLARYGVVGPEVGRLKRQGFLDLSQGRLTLDEASTLKIGMVFSFVMDTRLCDGAYEAGTQADLLVCESTYLSSESAEAAAHGHLTAAEAATIAAGAKVNTLALTHFSQRYESVDGFVEEARPIHANVIALEDGAAVAVPRRAP